MSVYLFTFASDGCPALPATAANRPRNKVRGIRGFQHSGERMTARYGDDMQDASAGFDSNHQRKLIDIIIDTQARRTFRCFGVATDATQLHALIAWVNGRDPAVLRAAVESSLVRGMNREFGRRTWFSEVAGQKRVRNRTHFDYLVESFLPKHAGLVWTASGGFLRSASRPACRAG